MKLTIPIIVFFLAVSACVKKPGDTKTKNFGLESNTFKPSDFFSENVNYSRSAGTRGFGGGKINITRKDEILHLKVPILFLGAGSFSRTTLEKVKSISLPKYIPTEEFFQQGMDSFLDNKMIRNAIIKMTKNIEESFESKHVRLQILVEFGKDSDYISASQIQTKDYTSYIINIRQGVEKLHSKKKTSFIPILIAGQPEATRASPSEWDIYSDPRLFAHELFHVIGTLFEGYECEKYPPYGIMQDDYMFNAMDQNASSTKHPLLQTSDLIEMLSNGYGDAADFQPQINNRDKFANFIEHFASSSICGVEKDMQKLDYLRWPHDKKIKAAQTTVNEFLSDKRSYSEFLK